MEEKNTRELSLNELETVNGGKHNENNYPRTMTRVCRECTIANNGAEVERVFLAQPDWANYQYQPNYYACSWCGHQIWKGVDY